MAESIETILFAQSKSSIDAYKTPQEMNKSLQTLVQALQARRRQQRAKTNALSSRQEFLRKLLGPEKYLEIKRMVEQSKLERLLKVGEECPQCRRLDNGVMVCPRPEKDKACHKFPAAVHGLFFQVNLLHALEFKSLQTWRDTDWDKLIQEAEEILRNYQNWRNLR